MFITENIYYNPDVVQEGDMPDEAAALAAEYCAASAASAEADWCGRCPSGVAPTGPA